MLCAVGRVRRGHQLLQQSLYVLVQILCHYYDPTELVVDQTVNAMAKEVRPLPELMKLAESIAQQ